MKRIIPIIFLFLASFVSRAQVFIVNDNMTAGRLSEIHVTVLDSLNSEPVPFASVYVIPVKDTTISNFTLTDSEGKAKLEEVPYGNYTFHIEMLGYKPYVKERYFRDRVVDLETIRLQVDENYLRAAMVTDVGNPIVVKKDTVEFNASSFQVGTNAMRNRQADSRRTHFFLRRPVDGAEQPASFYSGQNPCDRQGIRKD